MNSTFAEQQQKVQREQPPSQLKLEQAERGSPDHRRTLDFDVAGIRREGSNVVRSAGRRFARLGSMLPLTSTTEINSATSVRAVPSDSHSFYIQVSTWIAWNHIRVRDGYYIPSIGDRLKDCDIEFSLGLYDTEGSGQKASREIVSMMGLDLASSQHHTYSQLPTALIGVYFSSVSMPSSVLSGAYDVPQVSPSSTSAALDD
jgi:hypothetical protein